VKGEGPGATARVSPGTAGTAATALVGRSAVALYPAGARSGAGVPAADVGGAATQGQHRGGGSPCRGAGMSTMRPADDLPRYPSGFLAGALGTLTGLSVPLPLLALQTRAPTLVGYSGGGTGTHLRLVGSSVGVAGRRGAVRTGGTAGPIVAGGHHQRHGRVASGAAVGSGGGQL